MIDISVIVPIGGNSKYFFNTIIANIEETCGYKLEEFDLVFLTSKTVPIKLQEAFDEGAKKYQFRIINAPFETDVHLKLLDWAFRKANLKEWVFMQHMDTFWKIGKIDWLKLMLFMIHKHPNNISISPISSPRLLFNGKPFKQCHDFAAIYNKNKIVEKNWSFMWGNVKDLNLSKPVQYLIDQKKITDEQMKQKWWLDGSEVIALEAFVHCPDLISNFRCEKILEHVWSLIRPLFLIKRKGDELLLGVNMKYFFASSYRYALISMLSSCCMDINEDHIFPWIIYKNICSELDQVLVQNLDVYKIMSKYNKPDKVLGIKDSMGIKTLVFTDAKINVNIDTIDKKPLRLL